MVIERDIARIFEFDRSSMLLQLRSLRREIEAGAEEMEMVAAERVFREPLSRALVNEAGKLQVTAKELTVLKRLVERAHMPKDPLQPTPSSASRERRKTRS
jgi:deoxyribose-phosphate aldolase